MEAPVTFLVIALVLFGVLAAWAWWYVGAMKSARAVRREVGDSPADTQRTRLTKRAKRAQPLRVKICERQIPGRNGPQAVAARRRADPFRAGLGGRVRA